MVFEIEKRSLFKNKKDFEKLKDYLNQNASFLSQKKIISYLFRKPNYLRIRLEEDSDAVVITKKEGTYQDKARKEINKEINRKELSKFVKKIIEEGYIQCSEIRTSRTSYQFEDLKVELNEINSLGLIVEVEALAEKESDVSKLYRRVTNTLKKLKLKELSPEKYQKMMDEMYSKMLKEVSFYPNLN